MHGFLPRLVGAALLILAVGLLAIGRSMAAWLGRPVGWAPLWESLRGSQGAGGTAYKGYKAYTFIAGWFWFLLLELILGGFGIYLVTTGRWL